MQKVKTLYIDSTQRNDSEEAGAFNIIAPNFLNNGSDVNIFVQRFAIPYSFYNVDSRNDKFRVTESDADGITNYVTNLFSIDHGNYDSITFKNKILSLLSNWVRPFPFTYTILFDRTKHIWDISISEDNKKFVFEFIDNNSAFLQFGFNNGDEVEAVHPVKNIRSSNVVQLSGDHQIFIRLSGIFINSIDHKNKISNILMSKIIDVPHFHMITFERKENTLPDILINDIQSIDHFTLSITDKNGRILNFNGLDYELVLAFKYVENSLGTTE